MSTILLVDDYDDCRDALEELLVLLGHRALVARDGVQALRILRTTIPDLVLCDLRMPGMDGFRFMAALRHDIRLAEVKVIALTGYSDDVTLRRTAEAGFAGHLVKPLDYDRFPATLDHLLASGRRARLRKPGERRIAPLRTPTTRA